MVELLVVVLLILLNAFFAMSEMAVMTSRKLRLRQLGETSRGARKALQLAEEPDNLLSTVQVCITAISLIAGLFSGRSLGVLFGDALAAALPTTAEYAQTVGVAVAIALVTALSVIFGELVPKRLALTDPERIASAVALPLDWLSRVARPIVGALSATNRGVLRLLGIGDGNRGNVSEEEIRMLVTESHEQGVIDADERKMMNRVLSLGDRTAESLMTPRTRIAWLDVADTFEENLASMRATPFSRYPVYRGSDADVAGILEIKSLIDRLDERSFDLFKYLRPPLFVSESTHALKLLEIFREDQQSLALVVDEYGDVTGLVTMSDLMHAVIGRGPSNDADEDAHPIVEREDGSWLLDGTLPLEELRELIGGGKLPGEDEHDFHTAAGLTIAHFGRIPHVGESFDWDGWRMEVLDLDGPRVDKLLLRRIPAAGSGFDDGLG